MIDIFNTCWFGAIYVEYSFVVRVDLRNVVYNSRDKEVKILNGYENIDRNMFFSLKKDSRTRGHEIELVKDQYKLDTRKYPFSQRIIKNGTNYLRIV